eukprot:4488716-Lingulodinium_polyedra.AAC.1
MFRLAQAWWAIHVREQWMASQLEAAGVDPASPRLAQLLTLSSTAGAIVCALAMNPAGRDASCEPRGIARGCACARTRRSHAAVARRLAQ